MHIDGLRWYYRWRHDAWSLCIAVSEDLAIGGSDEDDGVVFYREGEGDFGYAVPDAWSIIKESFALYRVPSATTR